MLLRLPPPAAWRPGYSRRSTRDVASGRIPVASIRSYAAEMDDLDTPRTWRDHPAVDVVLAALVTLTLLLGSYGEAHPTQPSDKVTPSGAPVPMPPAWALGLVVLAGAILVLRRHRPVLTLLVTTGATAAFSLLGYVNGSVLVAPVLALYAVTSRVPPRRAVAWSAGTLAVLALVSTLNNPLGRFGGGVVLLPALVAAAHFAGVAAYNRRALLAAIRQGARDEARRQVDAERLRIARELHDVVAHTMATINVQATAAVHVMADQPEAAAEAMRAVKAASKEGLRELRAVLDVLRRVDVPDGGGVAPAPGLDQLEALVDRARHAGVPVTLTVSGVDRPLPTEVDLAAYRIVQESLTNVIRHAGPATAAVTVDVRPGAVHVEVTDTGVGPDDGGSTGFGLVGMRERVASVGGTVEAGRGEHGGFRVTATLPLVRVSA
jgi:signal transduction histidine kinase